MRWQLALQMAVGFGALFWLGREAVDKYLGPVARTQAQDAAEARAQAVREHVLSRWQQLRDAQGDLVALESRSSAFSGLQRGEVSEEAKRAYEAALGSLRELAGGNSSAAVFDGQGRLITSHGEFGAAIANLSAPKLAKEGATSVRFERMGDKLVVCSAAPIFGTNKGAPSAVLALATLLDANRLRSWTMTTTGNVGVALRQGDTLFVSTLSRQVERDLRSFEGQNELQLGDASYVIATGLLSDDAGTVVELAGLGRVETQSVQLLVGNGQLLVTFLGAFALLIGVMLVFVAPSPRPQLIEVPPEPEVVDETATERPRPVDLRIPERPRLTPIIATPSSSTMGASTSMDTSGAASGLAVPPQRFDSLKAPRAPQPVAFTAPEMNVEGTGAEQPIELPADALVYVSSELPGGAEDFAPPLPSMEAAPPAPKFPGESDVFSAIDQAAWQAPSVRAGTPSDYGVDPDEDLPAPKGGLPLGMAPSVAAQSIASDLPVPKGGMPTNFGMVGSGPLRHTNPNREILPPLSSTPPLPQAQAQGHAHSPSPMDSGPPAGASNVFTRETLPPDLANDISSQSGWAPSPPVSGRDAREITASARPPRGPSATGNASPFKPARDVYSAAGEATAIPAGYGSAAQRPMGLEADEEEVIPLAGSVVPPSPNLRGPDIIALPGSAPPRSQSQLGMNSGYGGPSPGHHEAKRDPWRESSLPPTSVVPEGGGKVSPVPFDEAHYRVVYNEFVASKARLGESVGNVSYEGFSAKLRNSEQELIQRHGCRAVRFQVLVKDKTVSLRPQLVR